METYNELTDGWLNEAAYLLAEKEITQYYQMKELMQEPARKTIRIKVGGKCPISSIIERKTNKTVHPYGESNSNQKPHERPGGAAA